MNFSIKKTDILYLSHLKDTANVIKIFKYN